ACRPLGITHAGALPLPSAALGDLEALLDPGAQAIPTRGAALGWQIGQDEPSLFVAVLPTGQQRARQAAGPTDKGRPTPLPARTNLGSKVPQGLEAVGVDGPKSPTSLDAQEGMPAQAYDAPIQPAGVQ